MKVLLIGSGGREHALAWAMAKSGRVTEMVCAPGNAGMAGLASLAAVNQRDIDDLLRVAAAVSPDLAVIGPELPLSLGLADRLQQRGVRVFGPTQKAAMLETSKSFAKRFMQRHNIPTAAYAAVSGLAEALRSLDLFHLPVVVKADGLAAGKGVVVCENKAQAVEAMTGLFNGRLLGSAEKTVVIEEFLEGEEVSFLCLTDGRHVAPLLAAQDHKRIGEGDTGPNTGGMGAYTGEGILETGMRDWVVHHIALPAVRGMAAEDSPFVGVLYIGLMMTARGPMVLEFNARFGDPETQAVLPRLESDLVEVLEACVEGRLGDTELKWKPGASTCVIAASQGYPGAYRVGWPIAGLEEAGRMPGVEIFHSGTAFVNGEYVTSGGRVVGAAAAAPTLRESLSLSYEALARIHFDGICYRRDIGHRSLKRS